MKTLPPDIQSLSRRDLLVKTGKLSIASMAMLMGVSTKAFAAKNISAASSYSDSSQDIDILNEILGTEYEGIGAYQVFVDGSLFQKDVLKMALLFQGHHKQHSDILVSTIKSLGGDPVIAKTDEQYASDLDTTIIKTQSDALQLMLTLELGAANAYINMLPSTRDRELAKLAGRIAADEVMHWIMLSKTLKEALPADALSFGA